MKATPNAINAPGAREVISAALLVLLAIGVSVGLFVVVWRLLGKL